jgi:hypothetical protein
MSLFELDREICEDVQIVGCTGGEDAAQAFDIL